MNNPSIKRALISVSDKSGLIEFAQDLTRLGVEIFSTGGTSKLLNTANIPHRQVEDITRMPEMLDGRVKTLHPKIHGGILGKRDKHQEETQKHGIDWIDLVVVNFYPFTDMVKDLKMPWKDVVEYIDIGGPTMVRAAAKNFAWTSVIVDPADYGQLITKLRDQKGVDLDFRTHLAEKAFTATAHYDAMIQDYFLKRRLDDVQPDNFTSELSAHPQKLSLCFEKTSELRYGENPHQKACAYQLSDCNAGVLSAKQHQGKPLSYNNLLDAEAALVCVQEFSTPACVIVKHANPCGVAVAASIESAYELAFAADPASAFGGIVALNRTCTKEVAKSINKIFVEVILAPDFTEDALAILATKPNLRVLQVPFTKVSSMEMKFITGGLLLQEKDQQIINATDLQIVTQMQPKPEDVDAMLFSWRVLKHIKSNGILIAKKNSTIGIGAGQVSRIDAVDIAVRKAGDRILDSVLASDAFFPFRDGIDRVAKTGVRAIIQPGGSVRDQEVIAACNEHGIAMVFTGKRCFKH